MLVPVLAGCGDPSGGEIVDAFHGYAWGTPVEDIGELAGTEPTRDRNGLFIHSTDVTYLGRSGLAAFYFHPRTEGLIQGAYAFTLSLEECEAAWERFTAELEAAAHGLTREDHVPRRPESERDRYVSDCEYQIFRLPDDLRSSVWVNPREPHDRMGITLRAVGRSVSLTVYFRGGAGEAWEAFPKWRSWLFRRGPQRPRSPPAPLPTPPPSAPVPPLG